MDLTSTANKVDNKFIGLWLIYAIPKGGAAFTISLELHEQPIELIALKQIYWQAKWGRMEIKSKR